MSLRIAVCIATYKRPAQLEALLESLGRMIRPDESTIEIRVVDNDANLSALPVVQRMKRSETLEHPIRYDVEPEPNISMTRNRALDMGPADLVFFVDDDEEIERDCLVLLCEAMSRADADAVVGFVGSRPPGDTPGWILRGRFLDHQTGEPGQILGWADMRCGCTLVKGLWFSDRALRFDSAFGRSGGEDVELFSRMIDRGARCVAEPRGRAWETVDRSRASFLGLCQRYWSSGLRFDRVERFAGKRQYPLLRFLARTGKGLWRVAIGTPLAIAGRRDIVAGGLLQMVLAAGGLTAWLNPEVARSNTSYGDSTDGRGGGGTKRCVSHS
jgi:succinoglycan biosynthesis protein ExoM